MTAAVQCTGVDEQHLGMVWREAAKLLEPALMDEDTIENVLTQLFLKKAQLWIAATDTQLEAACVTEIFRRGGKLYCNLWLTGGRGINNWFHFLQTIEQWAKEQGCDAMLIDRARVGWKRLLPNYKTKTITLVKEL